MTLRRLLSLAAVGLAACSAEIDEPPTPAAIPTAVPPVSLPTAVAPDEITGLWAVSFQYAFPDNFWPIGQHQYGFFLDCPVLGQVDGSTEYRVFQVTNSVASFDGPIYLRLGGLSTGVLAPINVDSINPEQATAAVVTILGVSEEQARGASEANDCEVVVGWDGVGAENLMAGEPFQP
jgi:hypothetical protein